MAYTLREFEREVKAGLNDREDFDSRLPRIINIAHKQLGREYNWIDLYAEKDITIQATGDTDADRRVTLPTDVDDLMTANIIEGATSRKLKHINRREWEFAVPLHQQFQTGKPYAYTWQGKQLLLYKVPEQEYTLRLKYKKIPTPLVEEKDRSDFENKEDLIISLALIYCYKSIGNTDRLKVEKGFYDDALDQAKSEEKRKFDQSIGSQSNIAFGQYWADPFNRDSYSGSSWRH